MTGLIKGITLVLAAFAVAVSGLEHTTIYEHHLYEGLT